MCSLKGCLGSKTDFVIQNDLNCTHGLTMMQYVIVSHVLFVSAINQKLKENVEKSFTLSGYSDRKYALSWFDEHQAASYHRLAMTYEVAVPKCDDVKEMQNESTASQMELNCRCFDSF